MVKPNQHRSNSNSSSSGSSSKANTNNDDSSKSKTTNNRSSLKEKHGLEEIDQLFHQKKQSDKEMREKIVQERETSQLERRRRKLARLDEEADEFALRGILSASTTTTAVVDRGGDGGIVTKGGKRKQGDAIAPSSLFEKATKLPNLTYTRMDVEQLDKDKWAMDGLGGIFNSEGYTGRRDDGGHRVFKAHLMNKKGFGQSPDCPFDCNCCFI